MTLPSKTKAQFGLKMFFHVKSFISKNFSMNNDNSDSSDVTSENQAIVNFHENENGFQADYMIDHSQLEKINKLKLKLDSNQVFRQPSLLQQTVNKAFSRKNKIFYCFNTEELSVDINDVSGRVFLPLLTRGEINKKLLNINGDIRKTLNMVHIGAVKILIKAQFRDGINFPIKMALVDNRIINRQDALIGAIQGNLAYGKFMFTVYPKFALNKNSRDFDKVLSFIHQCTRDDLMEPGNKVFTINYLVSYAITNSTHSIEYREKENISLEEIFSEIGSIEGSKFSEPSQLQSSWAIDIARNKPRIGQQNPIFSFDNNCQTIEDTPSGSSSFIRSVSNKIDNMSLSLKRILDE